MQVSVTSKPVDTIQADAVVVGCYSDGVLPAAAMVLDEATGGALTRLIEAKEITGKPGTLTTVLARGE